jgi:predicted dehydrogenase
VGAYLARPDRFRLVGACDPAQENAARFRARCPDVPLFEEASALLAAVQPHVVSICTPIDTHADILEQAVETDRVQLIWCEKPLATDVERGERIALRAAEHGIRILVSYVRRWTPLWREAKSIVASGQIGTVRCVRVAAPNRLMSVGSHAVDLALLFGGDVTHVRPLRLPTMAELGEPAVAALLTFTNEAYGIVQVTGLRDGLIVEAEVIGDDGRLKVREDRAEISVERFSPSTRYSGYRELGDAILRHEKTQAEMSPFIAIADEISELANNRALRPSCDGRSALAVQRVLNAMAAEVSTT